MPDLSVCVTLRPMSEQAPPSTFTPRDPPKLRVRASLAFIQSLRPALFVLLVLSAGFSLLASTGDATRLSPAMIAAAPIVFGAFIVLFAVYRLTLVSQRRYSLRAAFVQIALGAILWVLLLPGHRLMFSQPLPGDVDDVVTLSRSLDPRVRALALEVARSRPLGSRYAQVLVAGLDDVDPRVRAQADLSLRTVFGEDAARGASGAEAQARWHAALARRHLE